MPVEQRAIALERRKGKPMPRRAFGQADPTVRADALKRHALVRRLERREKWLDRAGVKPELYKEAIETLQAQMHATKLVPAGFDSKRKSVGGCNERPRQAHPPENPPPIPG